MELDVDVDMGMGMCVDMGYDQVNLDEGGEEDQSNQKSVTRHQLNNAVVVCDNQSDIDEE